MSTYDDAVAALIAAGREHDVAMAAVSKVEALITTLTDPSVPDEFRQTADDLGERLDKHRADKYRALRAARTNRSEALWAGHR